MCPRTANKGRETSYNLTSFPIILSFNLNNGQANESSPLNASSVLNIHDHLALDQYLDTLTNVDRNSSDPMTTTNSTIDSSQNTIFGYPMPVDLFSAFFATSVAAGGLIGYLKAGSKPSLIAGLAFGSLLGVGTYLTSVDRNNYYLTLGTSTVLATVMGTRFVRSGKFMPAGLISALSLSMIVRCVYTMVTASNEGVAKGQ